MEGEIDKTLGELREGVDNMRMLFEQSKAVQEEQEEFRMYLNTQAHRTSLRLCNLASFLTDFGPQQQRLRNIKEVSYQELLTPEVVKDKALITRKVRVLEQGEMPDSEDEEDLYNNT